MTPLIHDRPRCRNIVKLAAKEAPSARQWLTRDERGTWEKQAADLLAQSTERAQELALSTQEVDEQCAFALATLALRALLNVARNEKGA